MKKVFSFTQRVLNGTVTIKIATALFSTRELAENTLADVKASNSKRDLHGLRVIYDEIKETDIYETKEEIPFYQSKED